MASGWEFGWLQVGSSGLATQGCYRRSPGTIIRMDADTGVMRNSTTRERDLKQHGLCCVAMFALHHVDLLVQEHRYRSSNLNLEREVPLPEFGNHEFCHHWSNPFPARHHADAIQAGTLCCGSTFCPMMV